MQPENVFLPNPNAFTVFGHEIRWYAIFILIGMVGGVAIACRSAKKYGWTVDDIIDVALVALPSAVVGARMYYVIFKWDYYAQHPADIIKIWEGGLGIYGGIIAGIVAGMIYCKVKKRNIWELLDIGAPSIAFGQAVGRWGNFTNQEAFGAVVTNPSLQGFPASVYIQADGQFHYATFFYESAWCALIVVALLLLRKRFRHRGDTILCYAMLYSAERSIVEGLRMDSLYIGTIRVSQALSAILFVGIVAFFVIRFFKERKNPMPITNKLHPDYVEIQEEEDEPLDVGAKHAATPMPPMRIEDEKLEAAPWENEEHVIDEDDEEKHDD